MHIFQASLVANPANAMTAGVFVLGICVLGVGFMLHFLVALTKERKARPVGYRLEYRINNSAPSAANEPVRRRLSTQSPSTVVIADQRAYDRAEFVTGRPLAPQDTKLTFEYRFVDGSRQGPNRV